MVRFGKYGVYADNLSQWGKMGYFIHGNPHLLKFIQKHYIISATKRFISKRIVNVLDIACGTGDYAFYFAEKYPWVKVDAFDIDYSQIKTARKIQQKFGINNVSFRCLSVDDFVSSEKYDYVYCMAALHSFEQKELLFKKIRDALSDNGVLYVHDRLADGYGKKILNLPRKSFDYYRKNFFTGRQYSEEDFVQNIERFGLRIVQKRLVVGFFGQVLWEVDQFLQEIHIPYVRQVMIPVIKLFCCLEFLFPFGKKNEIFIVAQRKM